MNYQIKKNRLNPWFLTFLCVLLPIRAITQNEQSLYQRDSLIIAACEIINANPYCALITVDSTGQPQVRTMNPFPLGEDWIIWFATSRKSRKVTEINCDPRVCVYYADHQNAKGYVNIIGNAVVIDDKDLLIRMKRDYWEKNIPDWHDKFVLIRIVPKTLDVINYGRGITGEPGTNRSATVVF